MTRFADSFGLWLGDYYLLSTVLLALALIGIAVLKQPAQRIAIAKSTLVALALLAALCALPRWSVVHLLTAAPQQQAQANESPTLRLDANQPAHVVPVASPHLRTPESVASMEPAPNIIAPARDWPKISWPVVLTIVYLCGAIGVMAWLSVGSLAARGLRLSATPAPAELAALLAEISASRRDAATWTSLSETRNPRSPKQGRCEFKLLVSDRITVPVALGIHDPAILLPATWKDSPRDQLRSVLAHELTHIRNRDLSWLAASRVLLVLLWAQPIYWYLRHRMRLDQEALADAAAAELTSRQHYAEQLVLWARRISNRPMMRLSSVVGLWEGPSQIRRRVAMLIDDHVQVLSQCSPSWRLASFAACGVVAVALSFVTIAPAQTQSPAVGGAVDGVPITKTPANSRTPTLLSYGDGKPDGKKSYGGSGQMIRFELPEGVTKVKGIRIHGSRYGLPQAPNEEFEITFLSDKRDEVLQTETAKYALFKRGKENWVRVLFDKEVELPPKFWIALDFNAEQTKGVYLSYDISTKGEYSRVGKAGEEEEPKKTDFNGDWMVQVMLSPPPK